MRTFLKLNYNRTHNYIRNYRNFGTVLKINENSSSLEERLQYDVAIIGAGIIGAAIARELKIKSDAKCILIEKESSVGKHQSSHNSGVIHSGIYYQPESLKSKFCVKGANLLYQYCKTNNISYKKGGKLIVATECDKINVLHELYDRGIKNGVKNLKKIRNLEEIIKIEPSARGMHAIYSPDTGNVDFRIVTETFTNDFRTRGGDILLSNEVNCIKLSGECNYPIVLKCNDNLYLKSKYVILCGGLHSGTLSELVEKDNRTIFVSFRVDYQLLKHKYIATNVYAVPDLSVPFLGIHVTPRLDGTTLLGPTAVPAYSIEGYKKDEIHINYVKNTLGSPHISNLTQRYFSKCVEQITRQICPDLQIKALQKLVHFRDEEVSLGPTAVQTQLINRDGSFTDDFVFEFFEGTDLTRRIINCKFVPSPGATSSIAIAEFIVEKFRKHTGEIKEET